MRPSRIVWAMLALCVGCASGPETRPRVSYKVSAQENFQKGMKAFEDEDFLEAIEYFNFVKNKFPFSSHAPEADLMLAECEFERDKYLEAADAYANFIKLHPKHAKVPYANFRLGMAFYKRVPEEWWFLPPAFEWDPDETERAILELQRYLERFPQDSNVPEARKALEFCQRRMAARIHYIMDFYRKRHHPRAVVWRADQLLTRYAGLGFDQEALFRKGEAHLELGEPDKAREALQQLVRAHPAGQFTDRAKGLLSTLPSQAAAPAPASPPSSPVPTPAAGPAGEKGVQK